MKKEDGKINNIDYLGKECIGFLIDLFAKKVG